MAIQPEVRDLDAELSIFGGCARFISDDGYAAGPAHIVFPAVARFRTRIYEALGLVTNDKLECYSLEYDLFSCPHLREHLPEARIAGVSAAQLAQAGLQEFVDSPSSRGITVGNVPLGGDAFVHTHLTLVRDRTLSYSHETRLQRGDGTKPLRRWLILGV